MPLPAVAQTGLAGLCWAYLLLLPLVRAGMFYNQLAHRRLPALLQSALDEAGIEIPVLADDDGLAVRVSAQVYCDRDDIEQLAGACASTTLARAPTALACASMTRVCASPACACACPASAHASGWVDAAASA